MSASTRQTRHVGIPGLEAIEVNRRGRETSRATGTAKRFPDGTGHTLEARGTSASLRRTHYVEIEGQEGQRASKRQ